MKSTTLLALFLLSAFTSHPPSANADADLVYDTDGKPLRNGFVYYIMPLKGGGIERVAAGKETCPVDVVQSRNEDSKGLPVLFESPFLALYITEGLLLKIRFSHPPRCAPKPSWWTVVKGQPGGSAVKLRGYYGSSTIPGWFKIGKASDSENSTDYKLLFCIYDESSCDDIGIYKCDETAIATVTAI
ncbi:Chymotrypsin inhibitor 3 [Spatholobus suberectus]|nr:Chymotrypsin inhibitor 3 [Spatholobus suberectus]